MSLADFEKGQVWRLCGADYRIISVSASAEECKQKRFPPGDLVRGQRVGGDRVVQGTSRAWLRHAVKVA